ncbi:hypothetical protein B0H14DRAFT_2648982 [Mycena olivaceomarginata]|nr:hypothetical protein B0H14DRAFT_2648982 [Mycena olivaceomarginata]
MPESTFSDQLYQLREQNLQLRERNLVLQAENNVSQRNYDSLLSSLSATPRPPPESSPLSTPASTVPRPIPPIIILEQSEYPEAKYWQQKLWSEKITRDQGRTSTTKTPLASKNSLYFIANEHGSASAHRINEARGITQSLYFEFKAENSLPSTWGQAPLSIKNRFYAHLENEHSTKPKQEPMDSDYDVNEDEKENEAEDEGGSSADGPPRKRKTSSDLCGATTKKSKSTSTTCGDEKGKGKDKADAGPEKSKDTRKRLKNPWYAICFLFLAGTTPSTLKNMATATTSNLSTHDLATTPTNNYTRSDLRNAYSAHSARWNACSARSALYTPAALSATTTAAAASSGAPAAPPASPAPSAAHTASSGAPTAPPAPPVPSIAPAAPSGALAAPSAAPASSTASIFVATSTAAASASTFTSALNPASSAPPSLTIRVPAKTTAPSPFAEHSLPLVHTAPSLPMTAATPASTAAPTKPWKPSATFTTLKGLCALDYKSKNGNATKKNFEAKEIDDRPGGEGSRGDRTVEHHGKLAMNGLGKCGMSRVFGHKEWNRKKNGVKRGRGGGQAGETVMVGKGA